MIRTPDQRLRVFISSTLVELGPERVAVRAAIEKLRLIPVLFEGGARPHAPQDLYRAYLDQSDIFIGIYGASYGWVAPDMEISGLEDEFNLCGTKPRLIYVKNVSGEREPRLMKMLDRVRAEGGVSYQKFSTVEELGELVQNDLAVMLSERFGDAADTNSAATVTTLPVLRGPSIGREKEITALSDLLNDTEHGMITVTGPGGTGKSRLCLTVARQVQHRFRDGVVWVPLSVIDDPELVAPAIAAALGSFDNARRSSVDLLKDILRDKHLLLVLDNFEQVLPAATLVTELSEHCPQLKILVSSRTPLHVREEQVYALAPLEEPTDPEHQEREELLACPSVDLFVRRAREASADLVLDMPNVRAIAAICKKLDGLPLAIELAAAHVRMLQPVILQQRMENALSMLTRGARDLPERQRTMRAAIAWSHDLLDEPTRVFFRRLAVLADRFTLTDAHAVAGGTGSEDDTVLALELLVDQGLVRRFNATSWSNGENLFALLHIVREFALEALDASGERAAIELRHARYFSAIATDLGIHLLKEESPVWLDREEAAQADMRAAFWHWINTGDRAAAWLFIADQRGSLAHAGRVSEAFVWMKAAGVYPEQASPEISEMDKGRAYSSAGLALVLSGRYIPGKLLSEKAVDILEQGGERAELARALFYLGLPQLSRGDPRAMATLQRSAAVAERVGDDLSACLAFSFLCETAMAAGDLDAAMATLERARPIAERHRTTSVAAMYFHQMGNLHLLLDLPAVALSNYEESVRIFDEARVLPISGWAWWGLCYSSCKLGGWDRAREAFGACLDRARRTSDDAMVTAALSCSAEFALEQDAPERAAQLLGASEAIAAAIGFSFWSNQREQHADLKQRLGARLEPEQMEAAVARGKALGQEAAIALALEVAGEEKA